MHISDGVLSTGAVIVTSAVAGAMLVKAFKDVKEEEIPKISLMTATFFTFALISFPVGPSSVHPLLGGLIGIMLGIRSTIAIFVGLLLQAVLFQHGGLTTLGINTIMISIPAIIAHKMFGAFVLKNKNINLGAAVSAATSVILTVVILGLVLFFSNRAYGEGFLSVINILAIGHIPLAIGEAILTGFIIGFIHKTRPNVLEGYKIYG